MYKDTSPPPTSPTVCNMQERNLLTYPIWERYTVLSHIVMHLSVRERRQIFQLVRRTVHPSADLFFPAFGFTLSEFAVWHILTDTRRKVRRQELMASAAAS